MKEQDLPLGSQIKKVKPCSDCGQTKYQGSYHGRECFLHKGRNGDWLCRECAKDQKII